MSEFVLVRESVLAVSAVHQDAYLLDCALSISLRMLQKFAPRKPQVVQFYFAPNNSQPLQSHPHYLPQSPYERTGVYADVITKFSGIDRFPFSFRYGASLARTLEAPLKRRAGNESWEQESEKWEQNRELEMKLLVGLKFKLGFVPIFHFPFPRACSPLLFLRFSNIPLSYSPWQFYFVIVSFLFYFLFILLSFIITQKINHNIAGPLCFSGDVIKRNILLPKVL